jgi:hypothetical protein
MIESYINDINLPSFDAIREIIYRISHHDDREHEA